ncbi:MAG TPA: DUF222 domain-containing protein [Ilumatobacteraceae bacterium]|nr:DUF222 domain-containing protein [Ilumatobacteraceae bacterium]
MDRSGVIERVERIAEVRATPAADAVMVQSGLVAVREIRAWCDAQQAGLVTQLQAVSSFPEAAIAEADRSSITAATKTTERSETLAATPKLADALGDGAITAGHIDAVTRSSKQLDPAQREELLERADALEAVAAAGTVEEFRRRLDLEAKRLQADDGMERLARQRRNTRLSTWVDGDGMWNLRGRFDPVTGVTLSARLDSTVEALFAERTPDTAPLRLIRWSGSITCGRWRWPT